MYRPLSVDTIIESCLILMVLLLLTCARHLIVDCTASKSPIYPVTISSRGHQVVLCSPRPPLLTPLPSVTFSELSSKCHSVCYKSCISSLCLQVVAFCAETRRPGGSLSPSAPAPPKRKQIKKTLQWGGDSGRDDLPLRLHRQTSCIHPFIHPFGIHPSVDDSDDQDWNHRSGLLEEAMVLRRAVALCRRCSGWRRS